MQRNKILTIFGLGLLGVVAYFVSTSSTTQTDIDIQPDYFALTDTNSINKIEIVSANNISHTFKLNNRKWKLDDVYNVDQENISKFFLVFSRVRVKRGSSGNNAIELKNKLNQHGLKIRIYDQNNLIKTFIADDGSITSTTCFMDEQSQKPYFVEIPSLTDNFGHIFNIQAANWASKRLFSSTLRTLQSINIKQLPDRDILSITYNKGFFDVDGVQRIDTNAIGNYLIQYRDIKFDDFVPDSLTSEFKERLNLAKYTITVFDIDSLKNNTIKLVDFKEDPRLMIGSQSNNTGVFIISKARLKNIIVDKSSFEKK